MNYGKAFAFHKEQKNIRKEGDWMMKECNGRFTVEGVFMRFTLIELLIVVAIIAILAGMLLPVLGKAKDKAHSISCISNLKNMTLADFSYQGDYKEYFFPSQMDDAGTIPPSGKFLSAEGTWYYVDFLSPYFNQKQPKKAKGYGLLCPGLKEANKNRVGDGVLTQNYGVNQEIHTRISNGGTSFTPEVRKNSSVKYPASLMSAMDGGTHRLNWKYANLNNSKIQKTSYIPGFISNKSKADKFNAKALRDAVEGRHPGRHVNVGYADGHVNSVLADSLAVKGHNTIGPGNNFRFWRPDNKISDLP